MKKRIVKYVVKKEVWKDKRYWFFIGENEQYTETVLVKAVSKNHNNLIQKELEIALRFDSPLIAKPLNYHYEKEYFFISYALSDGIPLISLLQSGAFSLEETASIGVQLSECVHEVHRRQFIHMNINPYSVLYNQKTKSIKMIDFSLCSAIEDMPTVLKMKQLKGDFNFIAPEQTGQFNRPMDFRTDIYSIGALLYFLGTGEYLFKAFDPVSQLFAHVSKSPIPPINKNPGLTDLLSNIILKCVQKFPEDRYQSALGLKFDIKKYALDQKKVKTGDFHELGKQDISSQFRPSDKIYRKDIFDKIICHFEDKRADHPRMVLIQGEVGTGKSFILKEVQRYFFSQNVLFLKGNFHSNRKGIPYLTITETIRFFVKSILAENASKKKDWQTVLLKEMGDLIWVLAEFVPDLEIILGEVKIVEPLNPVETKTRLVQALNQFFRVVATKEAPLVLMLNNFQMADEISIQFISKLLLQNQGLPLFVMAAFRSEENFCFEVDVDPARILQIKLTNWGANEIKACLKDIFFREDSETAVLAQALLEKTVGNPFQVTRLILYLCKKDYIQYSSTSNQWTWKIEKIKKLPAALQLNKMTRSAFKELPIEQQLFLSISACLGEQFDIATISKISSFEENFIMSCLWRSVQAGLLVVSGSFYSFSTFQLQESVYKSIPLEQRKEFHYQIAKHFVNSLPDRHIEDRVFEIANHINVSNAFINQHQLIEMMMINFSAAKKAMALSAHRIALKHINLVYPYLSSKSWKYNFSFAFPLVKSKIECEYLVGKKEVADKLSEKVLKHLKDEEDRAAFIQFKNDLLKC